MYLALTFSSTNKKIVLVLQGYLGFVLIKLLICNFLK